jgi:hypothetical protein
VENAELQTLKRDKLELEEIIKAARQEKDTKLCEKKS